MAEEVDVVVLVVGVVAVVDVLVVVTCTYIGRADTIGPFTTIWSGPTSTYSLPFT